MDEEKHSYANSYSSQKKLFITKFIVQPDCNIQDQSALKRSKKYNAEPVNLLIYGEVVYKWVLCSFLYFWQIITREDFQAKHNAFH